MAHEIRASFRLTVRMDDLDVAVIARAQADFNEIWSAVMDAVKPSGFVVTAEPPSIVQIRAPKVADGAGVTGPAAGAALSQNATVASDDPEMPGFLRREARK